MNVRNFSERQQAKREQRKRLKLPKRKKQNNRGHPNSRLMLMTLATRKVNTESIFSGDHNTCTDMTHDGVTLFPYFIERFTTKILCSETKRESVVRC